MILLRLLLVSGVGLALLASASAPKQHAVERARQVEAPFEAVWTNLVEVFAAYNWPIKTMDKNSGLVATDWMVLESDSPYVDCGGSGITSVVTTQVRFNVFVRASEATRVTVNASFRQLRTFDAMTKWVTCNSTGRVEALIHSEVAARTAHEPAAPERVVKADALAPMKEEPTSALEMAQELSRAAFRGSVEAVASAFEDCGAQHPAVSGRVLLAVEVSPKGTLDTVEVVDSPDAALGRCVSAVLHTARFPETRRGGAFLHPVSFGAAASEPLSADENVGAGAVLPAKAGE